MATFTITTAVNIDSLAAKTGNDVYNINGGYLTVDQHSRFGTNQSTSATLGGITLSASLGGTIEFNSTLVRLIPYTAGGGVVPALGTAIVRGAASGKLLGVYSALNVAPTAAAAAMPATGFILIRQWNSVAYTAGALTGITATASGADVAGWLDIVGADTGAVTISRLNLFKVRGAYFEFLGVTTTGTNATTYQLPTNGGVIYVPGIEVETGTGTGIYEFYPCAGSLTALAANVATDAVRGKVCWISTAGLVRFQHDGTNSTGGYLVPAGRRIRVANIFFNCATVAAPTVNVIPSTTLTSRYKFVTTGGGVVDMHGCSMNWYCTFAQPYSISLTNFSTFTALNMTECASPITWSNVRVGQEAANSQIALTMGLNFAGGTMVDCVWTRATQTAANAYVTSWSDCSGFTMTNAMVVSLVKATNATTGSMTLTRVDDSTWNTPVIGGGRVFMTTCADVVFNNTVYYDNPALTTGSAIPMSMFDIVSSCLRCTFDGVSFGGLKLVQPYAAILNVNAAGCKDIKLRNLGTNASPLDLGSPQSDATWTRVTTTVTATAITPEHGLKVGDIIYCVISSDITTIVVGAKTITAIVAVSNTFSFAAINAGTTSGTLTYYPTMTGLVCSLQAGAAANAIKIQRCFTPHTRTGVITGDNSSKNIVLENVWGSDWQDSLLYMLNYTFRQVVCNMGISAQTAVYGTHFLDWHTTGNPTNTAGVAWSRVTTVATISSTAHNMKTGERIVVNVTSDALAIPKGLYTITALTANTFTIPCLNGGAALGTLTFVVVNARIAVIMNEPISSGGILLQKPLDVEYTQSGVYGIDGIVAATETTMNNGSYLEPFATATPLGANWVKMDFFYAIPINKITIGCDFNNILGAGDWGKSWTENKNIEYSTDNVEWFVAANTGLFSQGIQTYDLNITARYVRIVSATYLAVTEFYVESLLPSPSTQVTLRKGAAFTSTGGLYMPTVGQSAEFTAPANIIGHTSFPITEPAMSGSAIANYTVTYSMDNGLSYHNLSYQRAGSAGTAAAFTFTVTSGTGIEVGDYVWGTGIAPNAKVTGVATNTITVDTANTATVSGITRYCHIPSEVVADASIGFPLKIKIVTVTANVTPITNFFIRDASTVDSRGYTYPLETAEITFTGLPTGTDVVVLTAGTQTILTQVDAGAGSSFAYTYSGTPTIDVGFLKNGYVPFYIRNLVLSGVDSSIPVALTLDRNFI